RIAQPGTGFAPHFQQRLADIGIAYPRRRVGVPGKRRSPWTAARFVLGAGGPHRRVVACLGLPGDDALFDIDHPRTRAGAVDPVRRTHHLAVPPPLPIELLGAATTAAMQLTVVDARCSGGGEKLRLA